MALIIWVLATEATVCGVIIALGLRRTRRENFKIGNGYRGSDVRRHKIPADSDRDWTVW